MAGKSGVNAPDVPPRRRATWEHIGRTWEAGLELFCDANQTPSIRDQDVQDPRIDATGFASSLLLGSFSIYLPFLVFTVVPVAILTQIRYCDGTLANLDSALALSNLRILAPSIIVRHQRET